MKANPGEIDELGAVLPKSKDGEEIHVVTKARLCSVENSVVERFEEYGCLYQSVTVHRDSWEQYNSIAFDEENIGALPTDLKPK